VDEDAIRWERVRRLTFVPFLHDGRCALVPAGGGLELPSGAVLDGEDPMLDTGLRVPPVTAGFRRQGLHPFAVAGDHVFVWGEGDDGYQGARPHAEVELCKGPAADRSRHADQVLRRLGFPVDGRTAPDLSGGRGQPPSAWIERR
jgi:hypothetical protein